ncbi:hypothetical protein T190607A01A_50085 [Tenacibaculum sp. 190524A05c]|uniref:Uncharacterized protein n=1 Tax=Tenacibaculum platacis TaxID=3137852 RepID=A0ABM9P5J3_9FLAO
MFEVKFTYLLSIFIHKNAKSFSIFNDFKAFLNYLFTLAFKPKL